MKKTSENILKYDVVFEEQPRGGYTVTVPSLPGCISEGDTFEESKANIEDAIKLYLEDMAAEGEEIPNDSKSIFVGQVKIHLDKSVSSI